MQRKKKTALWLGLAGLCIALLIVVLVRHRLKNPVTITGAIVVEDTDPRKQRPIADVEITTGAGSAEAPAKSDSSGLFTLELRQWVTRGQGIPLKFRHPDYKPLDLKEIVNDKLYVIHMSPVAKGPDSTPNHPTTTVGNIRVRYSIKAMRTMNVGSAVETFQVQNVGNVPCKGQSPCSPDGKWKATIGSTTLDAGLGNEFRNVRVSCIAGPCPFTKIESDDLSRPSQKITASARNWSDTATFLVEAEVIHTMQSQNDHQSYPVVFGRALNFTLPSDAEGVSLEADMAGETIIFPLGPTLFLSWANCNSRVDRDQTNVYRCELKPGYRFQ